MTTDPNLNRLLDVVEHALSDLSPEEREPIDHALDPLVAYVMDLHREARRRCDLRLLAANNN